MDLASLRTQLEAWDVRLFMLGQAEITVSSLVKLAFSAWLLMLVAGRLSRFTLGRLLSRSRRDRSSRRARRTPSRTATSWS